MLVWLGVVACGGSGRPELEPGRVELNEVALYQALEIPLMKDGAAAAPRLPIVAERGAMVRVFLTTSQFAARMLDVALTLTPPAGVPLELKHTQAIAGPSKQHDLRSTINFELPASLMVDGTSWSVRVSEPGDAAPLDRWPATGEAPLLVTRVGALKVDLVPIVYAADGSNRAPPTTADVIAGYRARLMALYPVTDVALNVIVPLAHHGVVGIENGWSELDRALDQRRTSDGAAADVYYLGLILPGESYGAWCANGCTTGATLGGSKASTIVAFPESDPTTTAAHELAHAHELEHSPCGFPPGFAAGAIDPEWPTDPLHDTARIGTWGYDATNDVLIDPLGPYRDFLNICGEPHWVSDFIYRKLADRIRHDNGLD